VKPALRRELSLSERAGPWILVTLVASLVLVGAAALAVSGALGDPELWGDHLRGYTGTGIFTGALAALLCFLAAGYSLRKRSFQEKMPFLRGTLAAWLWLHVALGVLAVVAVLVHAGPGAVSLRLSSGKALLAVLAGIVGSGIVWRVRYATVPQEAARTVRNYAEAESARREADLRVEIEAIAAGKSDALRALKDWILQRSPSGAEIARAGAQVPPAEQADLAAITALAESRRRALERLTKQRRYVQVLQGLRIIHVPLTLLLLPALVAHVVLAPSLPARLLPVGAVPVGALSGFHPSSECKSCHTAIYEQWSGSMHARAMNGPVMIAQNNQVYRGELSKTKSPDPALVCVNCHGPVGMALAPDGELPLARAFYDDELLNEGVGCTVCHQLDTGSSAGQAGLSSFQAGLVPGDRFFGPYDDPAPNAYHQSAAHPIFREPGALCANCHTVAYDTSGDGKVVKGEDLVLQQTYAEHLDYRKRGGAGTCQGCHMPLVASTRAADGALALLEQDVEAPAREVRDHSFVGVDAPLDVAPESDPHREARQALLGGAATVELDAPKSASGNLLRFKVRITNTGAGHNLPTGFAFARQMWLEVTVHDKAGQVVTSSGLLAKPSDDLCDGSTVDEAGNPARPFVRGCPEGGDPNLVSFQQKLIDRYVLDRDARGEPRRNEAGELLIAPAPGAREVWLQTLTAGVVPRVRADGKKFPPIAPFDTRTVDYALPLKGKRGPMTLTVRLLMRNLPPYFVRAIASGQPADEEPKLAPLVENLRVIEMRAASQGVTVL
jgi:hypothetical protein